MSLFFSYVVLSWKKKYVKTTQTINIYSNTTTQTQVRSSKSTPEWISPLESLKLGVGESNFECCKMNHKNSSQCAQIQMHCSLKKLIILRANKLFKVGRTCEARCVTVLTKWWLRSLKGRKEDLVPTSFDFRIKTLRWDYDFDSKWIDRDKVPFLVYACAFNQRNIVKETIEEVNRIDRELRAKILSMQ